LKFKTGNEFIQLENIPMIYDSFPLYSSSSITVNIWVKLKEPPVSKAYIFRCQFVEDKTVRI